jgi:hypothetical protein
VKNHGSHFSNPFNDLNPPLTFVPLHPTKKTKMTKKKKEKKEGT